MASAEIIFTALPNSMNNEARGFLIGASLSEPHIDEFAVEFVYIYVYIRERDSVLYLGMATEILNLPYFCITQIANCIDGSSCCKVEQTRKFDIFCIKCCSYVYQSQW